MWLFFCAAWTESTLPFLNLLSKWSALGLDDPHCHYNEQTNHLSHLSKSFWVAHTVDRDVGRDSVYLSTSALTAGERMSVYVCMYVCVYLRVWQIEALSVLRWGHRRPPAWIIHAEWEYQTVACFPLRAQSSSRNCQNCTRGGQFSRGGGKTWKKSDFCIVLLCKMWSCNANLMQNHKRMKKYIEIFTGKIASTMMPCNKETSVGWETPPCRQQATSASLCKHLFSHQQTFEKPPCFWGPTWSHLFIVPAVMSG